MSRWAHWSRGTEEKGKSFGSFLKEDLPNTGNPSAAMGPAERAASLGLQSNGKGGYIDPNTGQVVARTVNNELIFYDNNRATGGAISDSSGGAALTQAQPSWADPLTGMLTTPPSKAETPSEIAAIPDPTPATAPFGYNAFMKQKKMAAYQQNAVEPQERRMTPDEIEQKNAEEQQGDASQQPAFSAEDYQPGDLLKKLGKGQPQTMAANVAKAREQQNSAADRMAAAYDKKVDDAIALPDPNQTAPQVQQKDTQTPAQPSVVQPKIEVDPDREESHPVDKEVGVFKNKPSMQDVLDPKSDVGAEVRGQVQKPTKDVSAFTPSVPKFAQGGGFTDQLVSDNDTYLNKIQESGYSNGVEYRDLRTELGDSVPRGVAGKYLDVLSRALVTKNVKGETDNWRHYGEGLAGGAGQINSQMGELMTLMMSNVPTSERGKLADIIRSQIQAAKKSGMKKRDLTVTEDWLDASLANAEAIDRYIQLEGNGATVVGGAWDQVDELTSLGIGGEGGEEKGFSTDIVIRDSNGKNHQISLKKDGNVNFLNSGAGQYTKYYLSGAAEDPENPQHEIAKQYLADIDEVNEIYSNLGMGEYDGESLPEVPTQKELKEEYGLSPEEAKETVSKLKSLRDNLSEVRSNNDIVPKGYNLSEYNKVENETLDKNFRTLRDDIKKVDLDSLNTPASELFAEAYQSGNFPEELYDRFFDEDGNPRDKILGKRKTDDKEEYERAKALFQQSIKDAKSGQIKDKIEKLMKKHNIDSWETFVDRLQDNDIPKLSRRERNKIMMNAIFATKSDVAEEHRTQIKERERTFAANAIEAIKNDPVMKSGTLNSLRKNFPLKDVAEGKESMVIGDATFSKKVLEKMFGTTDFNQIKDRLTVETDARGVPYLGYQVEIDADDDGEAETIIPIANVNIRADGLGYGNTMKHEMQMRPDFYKRLQQLNAELGTNLTTEDVLNIFFRGETIVC